MVYRNLRRMFRCIRIKNGRNALECIAKTSTFMLWAVVYMLIMRLTIFKSDNKTPEIDVDLLPNNDTGSWMHQWAENFQETVEQRSYENYSEDEVKQLEKEYEERRKQVWKTCTKYGLNNSTKLNHREFIISPQHNLVWCNIFKAASSSWMYNFNILGGYKEEYLKRSRETPLILARLKFPRPSLDFLEVSLPGSLSFLIVREPFERLLSAFRNKLEGNTQKFYRKIGFEMISKYRNATEAKFEKIKNYGPTFYEFVKYITENYKTKGVNMVFDEHWAPYYRFCTPCSMNFSVIAKVETLKRDTEYIVYQTGLETLLLKPVQEKRVRVKTIMNKSKDGKDTKSLLKKYFRLIDKTMLDDLLKIYGIDFEMFGYNPKKYYSMINNKK